MPLLFSGLLWMELAASSSYIFPEQPHASITGFIAQHCNDLVVLLFSNQSVNALRATRHRCLDQLCILSPCHRGW